MQTSCVIPQFSWLHIPSSYCTGQCSRVLSLEISGGKFPGIHSNLSGNLSITYVNQLFPSPALQSDAV